MMKNTSKDVREFAWAWPLGVSITGGIFYWRDHSTVAAILWSAALIVFVLSHLSVTFAKRGQQTWLKIAQALAWCINSVAMIGLFWGVLSPLAIFFRWRKRDILCLQQKQTDTYWKNHPPEAGPESYDHLF